MNCSGFYFCKVIFALFGTVVNAAIGLHCWCSKSSENVIGKFLLVNTLAFIITRTALMELWCAYSPRVR